VQAEYRRGQAQGDIYVTKSEIRTGSIDQMSKEEVMKALNELKQTYQPLTHDVDLSQGNKRSKAKERIMTDDEEVVDVSN